MTLQQWFDQRGGKILDQRDKQFARMRTPRQVGALQDRLRDIARRRMGPWVMQQIARSGQPRMINSGEVRGDGFVIEKFLFEAMPGMWVPTLLWRPANLTGKHPAIVMPVGHWWEGKAQPMYQRLMRLLARRGIICVSFDGAGQGERVEPYSPAVAEAMSANRAKWEITPTDKRWEPLPWVWNDAPCHGWFGCSNVTSLHCIIGDPAYLLGISPAGYSAIAGKRLIDLLLSRPDVDPERLGGCGASGGGTDLRFLQSVDSRLAAIAPVGILGNVRNIHGGDADQSLPGITADGIAHSDLLICHAPRPLLLVSSTEDRHDVKSVADFYRPIWKAAGDQDNIEWGIGEGEHGFPKPSRKIIAEFFLRRLAGDTRPIDATEDREDEKAFPESELWTTPNGNVGQEDNGWTINAILGKRAKELSRGRKALRGKPLRAAVLTVLQESEQSVARKPVGVKATEKEIRWMNEGIQVRLAGKKGDKLILLTESGVDGASKTALGRMLGALKTDFAAIDVRGCGITSAGPRIPEGQLLRWLVTGTDSNLARNALHQDRTLLGMRTVDLLQAASLLGGPVTVVAEGAIGFAAILAAFLRPQSFSRVILYHAPLTWESLVEIGGRSHNFAHYLPGVLESFDVPDLIGALPKGMVSWICPTDVSGAVVDAPKYASLKRPGAGMQPTPAAEALRQLLAV